MSATVVTEADFKSSVMEMFKALDLDQNDVLDWDECRELVASVVKKQDGGYNANSFKTKYDAMDKNADGKISKAELLDAVVQIGRERNLFADGTLVRRAPSNPSDRPTFECAVQEDPNVEAVDVTIFREGLSCLGKTFNNARHAYLNLTIANKSLTTLKVSCLFLLIHKLTWRLYIYLNRALYVTSTFSSSTSPTIL